MNKVGLGQCNSLGEYCGLHTALSFSVFFKINNLKDIDFTSSALLFHIMKGT